jgi:hypothetical protein
MNRFRSHVGIATIFFIGIFVVSAFGNAGIPRIPTTTIQSASSTLAVVNTVATTSAQTPIIPVPKKVVPPAPKPTSEPAPAAPLKATPISAPTSLLPSESASLDASAVTLRAALVNIICYAPAGSGLRSISGSGVIVDPKGIILTNAHIAQNFLLADRNVSCTIRAGSPAIDTYKASLIYISPAWIQANANILTQTNPSGTGEYDFAFLAITKSATSAALPSSFPFIPLATAPPPTGTPVVIASYGAQFLESNQIQSFLFPTIVFGSVKDVFTFAATTIDVLTLGGSAAAQEGSSGGGVADGNGKLVGTITTSTTNGPTDTRKLDAITASYIRAEYANETGRALDLLLTEATSTSVANFAPQIPALESILTANLK